MKKAEEMERSAEWYGNFFKYFAIFNSIGGVLGSAAITIVSATSDSVNKYYALAVIGAILTAREVITGGFKLNTKGISNFQVSIKLRQFIRKLHRLRRKQLDIDALDKELDILEEDFDLLKLSAFADGNMREALSEPKGNTNPLQVKVT